MIENPKAARVRSVAALSRKKDRRATGRFLVEGPQAVRELITVCPDRAEVVYTTTGAEPWQREIDRLASEHGVTIERVTDPVLAAMADTVTPQGVVAVARMVEAPLDLSPGGAFSDAQLAAILHEVRDPGNAGAVLRAADAAGADVVVFSGASVDPWHPKVVRSTTGSLFHVRVATSETLEAAVRAARAAHLTVLAADVRGEVLRPGDRSLAGPVTWVFGNEARGLSDDERALADRAVRLPIYGSAESLNLATAAGVLLYQSAFAQHS